jgi:hypothetical protein
MKNNHKNFNLYNSRINNLTKPKQGDQSIVEDLYSYLYSDSKDPNIFSRSKNNLETLINLFNKDKMVSFVGAGTSKPLEISDWNNLMDDLYNEARNRGFEGSFKNNPKEWPQLAQEIYEYLEIKGNIDLYFSIIAKKMSPKNNTTTLTLIKMVLAIDLHLTTNFDNSIENAYRFLDYMSTRYKKSEFRKDYQIYCLPDFPLIQITKSLGLICYLHGRDNKKIYILKKDDYETFYPSVSNSQDSVDCLENFLKECYKRSSIIFIGFSFRDYYVKEFFFKLAKEIERENKIIIDFFDKSGQSYKDRDIRHFLIVDPEILKEYENKAHDIFENFNIYPIIYKEGEHIFLEKLFEKLSLREIHE